MSKQCSACLEIYDFESFYRDKARVDGLMNRCIVCYKNKDKSVIRQKKKSLPRVEKEKRHKASCKAYEKTRKGLLMRTYRNMKSRVLGIQKEKAHIYKGLPILDKKEFYLWAAKDVTYNRLFDAWVASEYSRKLTPSIDRIDSTLGYEKENMRWLTHSENSYLGNRSRYASLISTLT